MGEKGIFSRITMAWSVGASSSAVIKERSVVEGKREKFCTSNS